MGIIRRLDEAKPIRIEEHEEFNYADYDLSESDNEVAEHKDKKECNTPVMSRTRRRREERAEKKLHKFLNALDTETQAKKNMGARKQRRIENARLLLSFVDKEDICTDFTDIVPQTMSVFAQLFEERENMKIWNEFILLEEEDQRRILENADRRNKNETLHGDGWAIVGGRSASSTPRDSRKKNTELEETVEDHRKHHPAYSAKACFDRIDNRLKQVLQQQKCLPWAFVDKMENQLRTLYTVDSSSVWVGICESGLHRMLVHAVSQYLMLTSKSITDSESLKRMTEVRNPRAYFVPPHDFLIPHLERLRKKKIEFVPEDDEEENNEHQEFNAPEKKVL
ncbi:unnamed protein product, partial [Mesorhabditis belari]|uniref:R3H-associated N-terminal domain-containing protein n=1 Tax=Mesorhabditis belari TaxID=2138241 RepID=A0AAF3EZK5_9BILA